MSRRASSSRSTAPARRARAASARPPRSRVGYRFCDTGLLYRAVTWLALARGVSGDATRPPCVGLVDEVELAADGAGRLVARRSSTASIAPPTSTRPPVDAAVSAVSAVPELRAALLERQRALAAAGGIVMAGRDIGTVVLPDADLKLFLDASVEERARRRAEERGLDPAGAGGRAILEALRRRDELDSTRAVAPLRPAPDARIIATDGNRFEDTVDAVVGAIRDAEARRARAGRRAARDERRPRRRAPARSPRSTRRAIDSSITPLIRTVALGGRVFGRASPASRIEGALDEIPREGPLILAANHASNLDVPCHRLVADPAARAGGSTGSARRSCSTGRSSAGWRPTAASTRSTAAPPTSRRSGWPQRILDEGHVLFVFPEGTRSPTARSRRHGRRRAARPADRRADRADRRSRGSRPGLAEGPAAARIPAGASRSASGAPFRPADELPAGHGPATPPSALRDAS